MHIDTIGIYLNFNPCLTFVDPSRKCLGLSGGQPKSNLFGIHHRTHKHFQTFVSRDWSWDLQAGLLLKPIEKKLFTFTKNNPFMQSRLDHWLISEDLEGLVIRFDIISSIRVWPNVEYVKQMKDEIIRLKEELKLEINDRRIFWDYMKMKIRSFSQAFSKRLSHRSKREKRIS